MARYYSIVVTILTLFICSCAHQLILEPHKTSAVLQSNIPKNSNFFIDEFQYTRPKNHRIGVVHSYSGDFLSDIICNSDFNDWASEELVVFLKRHNCKSTSKATADYLFDGKISEIKVGKYNDFLEKPSYKAKIILQVTIKNLKNNVVIFNNKIEASFSAGLDNVVESSEQDSKMLNYCLSRAIQIAFERISVSK